jgi:hypothetical protein
MDWHVSYRQWAGRQAERLPGSISMSRSQQKDRQKNSRMCGQTRYWKGRMEWLRFIQHPDRIFFFTVFTVRWVGTMARAGANRHMNRKTAFGWAGSQAWD